MIDDHFYPQNWGIRPVLFSIGNINIDSYTVFVVIALLVGLFVYFYEAKRQKTLSENSIYIALAALIGGALGAKVFAIIIYFGIPKDHFLELLVSGRTIVGGLIGGAFGVWLIKKIFKIKERHGDLFAPAIAIGIAIGRLGCFLRGCCYGIATNLPIGFDFGDGVLRHPAQLYESVFMFGVFIYFEFYKKNYKKFDGELYYQLLNIYFIFRFFIEFIKFGDHSIFGLTIYQVLSILVLLFNNRLYIKKLIKNASRIKQSKSIKSSIDNTSTYTK